MAHPSTPFFPIIYVRGYAMTPNEIDETSADPFCGFNLGSTVFRAVSDRTRQPRKYVFQSPVVRLASDFGYSNVYQDGYDILDPEWETDATGAPTGNTISNKSIIIFRYYDEASRLLGKGSTPSIETFSLSLAKLVLRIRDLVCQHQENLTAPADFRCYLVAHSMGGLVCRAMLQNVPANATKEDKAILLEARKYIDKLFTYATPHNGIEMAGVNVPGWLTANDIDNFSHKRMTEYLGLEPSAIKSSEQRVDWLPEESFPIDRVFCMVATNRSDYDVAKGLSRTFCGSGSDGLVKIENATLWELKKDGTPGRPCAKAFTFRAHSGYFGIVNGEEAYQNLTRFLFGDVRVDMWLDVEDIRLPRDVQAEVDKNKTVNALYQFEVLASPRGKLWYLTRRIAEEDSVACMTHQSWLASGKKKAIHLSTVFLAKRARVDKSRQSMAYAMTIGIKVPDYEIENRLWINDHFEGTYLCQDTLILELTEDPTAPGGWSTLYYWKQAGAESAALAPVVLTATGESALLFDLPAKKDAQPGLSGKLRFIVSTWNASA